MLVQFTLFGTLEELQVGDVLGAVVEADFACLAQDHVEAVLGLEVDHSGHVDVQIQLEQVGVAKVLLELAHAVLLPAAHLDAAQLESLQHVQVGQALRQDLEGFLAHVAEVHLALGTLHLGDEFHEALESVVADVGAGEFEDLDGVVLVEEVLEPEDELEGQVVAVQLDHSHARVELEEGRDEGQEGVVEVVAAQV